MSVDKNPEKIKNIFNDISNYYDFMNDVISLGLHRFIKTICIQSLNIKPGDYVLDACCGSGDISSIIGKTQPKSLVIGLDFSKKMIKSAKSKYPKQTFILGDCTDLPFKNCEFDFVTITFGLRNIEKRQNAIAEINRVLKSGGKFLHLDFGYHNILWKSFDYFVKVIVMFFKINKSEYEYLIHSKKEFPEPIELIEEFEKCGLKFLYKKDFLFGAISAQVMKKP